MKYAVLILLFCQIHAPVQAQLLAGQALHGAWHGLPAAGHMQVDVAGQHPSPGLLLAQGARLKNYAIFSGLLFGGMAAAMAGQGAMDDAALAGMVALGGGLTLGFSLAGNGKHIRAGKRLQELGY